MRKAKTIMSLALSVAMVTSMAATAPVMAAESAKVSVEIRAKWGKMIERYLHGSPQLKKVFLLIDIRHVPSENDCMMYDWIVDNGYEPVIICTKLDKIKRSQVQKNLKLIREKLDLVPGTTMIPFSAQTKHGRDEIWSIKIGCTTK